MRFILVVGLVVASFTADAEGPARLEGRYIVSHDSTQVFEFYPDSAKERYGYPSAWFLVEYPVAQRNGARSSRQLIGARCEAEEVAVLSMTDYDQLNGAGKPLVGTSPADGVTWSPVSPETSGATLHKVICAANSGNAADFADAMATYAYGDDEAEAVMRKMFRATPPKPPRKGKARK